MKKVVKFVPLSIINIFESQLLKDTDLIERFLKTTEPEVLEEISKKKAIAAFKRAYRTVPAYKRYLHDHHVNHKKVRSIEFFDGMIPMTTKDNYVRKYPYEDRCVGGKFPSAGNIDESSGSTGTPTNWIRSFKEEQKLMQTMKFGFRYLFKIDEKTLVVSCWSSGAWATGVKFCEIVERFALVKNVGTDIDKAVQTINAFGNKYRYILTGYPPFMKELLETKKIDWKKYKVDIITGGDGVAAGWDEHIHQKIGPDATIISAYGSSDVDIGVAFETPLSKKIRDICAKDPDTCLKIFKDTRVPMVFQYNPLLYYIQNKVINHKREFLTTALDENIASPKIKYALHDEGGRIGYNEMIQLVGLDHPENLRMPFLYVFGRSDGTISLDGANVYPQQVERAIMSDPKLGDRINKIMIEKRTDKDHNIHFLVHAELTAGAKKTDELRKKMEILILKRLLELNADYRESYTNNKKLGPKAHLYAKAKGPFTEDSKRLKHKYIIEHEK